MKGFKNKIYISAFVALIPLVIKCTFVYESPEAKPNKAGAEETVVNFVNVDPSLEDQQILKMKSTMREHDYIKKERLAEREMRKKKPYKLKIISEITAYTNYVESTGKNPGDKLFGVTASGVKTQQGRTVAMSKNYPFGTKLKIEGFGDQIFVVEDRGGAIQGNRIDLYMKNVGDAKKFGRQTRNVYILEMGKRR